MSAPSRAQQPRASLLSRLLCCRAREQQYGAALSLQPRDMGAALSHTHDGNPLGGCSGPHQAPATMAEVVRERKKKCGAYGGSSSSASLGTLRRRLAAAARARARACARASGGASRSSASRASRGPRPDHARCLRAAVAPWRPAEAAALLGEYDALAALRDVCTQAELARPPARALGSDLTILYDDSICPDAELVFKGSLFPVHRAILSARCAYFRDLLSGYPSVGARVSLENGGPWSLSTIALDSALRALYSGDIAAIPTSRSAKEKHSHERCQYMGGSSQSGQECCTCPCRATQDLDIISVEADSSNGTAGRRSRVRARAAGTVPCCASLQPNPDVSLIRRLAEEFGFRPDTLHHDLRYLLDSGDYADASLVFTSEPAAPSAPETSCGVPPGPPGTPPLPPAHSRLGGSAGSEYGFRTKFELPCHKSVLCARSPFFRNIIVRRSRRQRDAAGLSNGAGGWCPPSTVRIALDESVVPRRFARALLHAAYTDQVDLSLISRVQGQTVPIPTVPSSRSNAAVVAQQTAQTMLEDAMELYEIGRFVEMDIVSQGCEDAIIEALTPSTLPRVLKWSSLPHGSKWVYRQAMRYLRDEFTSVCAYGGSCVDSLGPSLASGGSDEPWGGALASLERPYLAAALRSPFLQASEAQALRAVVRWGEARLAKRMEDREPNVVMGTAHSVARRGIRRRDLSDSELRELIAPLVRLLRLSHVLPNDPVAPDILNQAMRRGLLSTPPAQLVSAQGSVGPPLPALGSPAAWLGHGPYARPRLFMPYYEEVKALLEDQMIQESEILRVRRARYGSDIPDTLYMVDSRPRGSSNDRVGDVGAPGCSGNGGGGSGENRDQDDTDDDNDNDGAQMDASSMDAGANANNEEAVAPPSAAMLAMQRRETELLSAPAIVRALALPLADVDEIRRQIRLRVVREHNYPDAVADVLACVGLPMNQLGPPPPEPMPTRNPYHFENMPAVGESPNIDKQPADGAFKRYQDQRGAGVDLCLDAASLNRSHRTASARLPAIVTEGNIYGGRCEAQPSCSVSRPSVSTAGLSEAMPDVAMATGAALRHHAAIPASTRRPHGAGRSFNIDPNGPSCATHAAPPAHSLPRPLYLNGNQHLLQDAGLRNINYPSGSSTNRRAFWPGQDWPSTSGGLQLDLGDGAPHATTTTTAPLAPPSTSTATGALSNRSSYCGQSPASNAAFAGASASLEPPQREVVSSLERHRRRPNSQPHDHLNSQRSDRSRVPRPNSSACVLYSPADFTHYLTVTANNQAAVAVQGYSTLQNRPNPNPYRAAHTQPCSIDDETVGGMLSTPGLSYATLAAPPPYSHRSASPSTLHPLNYPQSSQVNSNYPTPMQQGHAFRRTDSCNLSTLSLGSSSGHYYARNYEENPYSRESALEVYPRVESPFVSIQHAEASRGGSPAGPSRGSSPYAYREEWPPRKLSNSPAFSRPSSRGQGSFRDRAGVPRPEAGIYGTPRSEGNYGAVNGAPASSDDSGTTTPRFM